jgi:hypothetical protein
MNQLGQASILSEITTHNEHGQHFLSVWPWSKISDLEAEGLITITRARYMDEWTVSVTDRGAQLIEDAAIGGGHGR